MMGMGLGREQDIVPVLTYHSVGMNNDGWVWKHLSEPAGVFARLIERLASAGYRTVTLDQLYAHMAGEDRCPPKSVVLVFDDGYLDNWTIVAPLLERHGMSGVVYVNPEFVDPGRGLRPQRAVGEGPQSEGRPTDIGFMNWDELRAVDEAGVLDVQSHSLTHTWYYTGPAIESCHVPANAGQYPWMAWNARPDRKPFYMAEDQSAFVATGTPIFEHEKSLIARRFFPDPAALERVIASFPEFTSDAPACSGPWIEDYRAHVARVLGSSVFPGRHESDAEREARVREDRDASSRSNSARRFGICAGRAAAPTRKPSASRARSATGPGPCPRASFLRNAIAPARTRRKSEGWPPFGPITCSEGSGGAVRKC